MTVFSLIFIAVVILIYFLEIKWRKKHNKPLNKGKPIDGGQFIVFWVLGSVLALAILLFIVFFEGVQNSVSGKILQFHHTIQSSFKINGQLA